MILGKLFYRVAYNKLVHVEATASYDNNISLWCQIQTNVITRHEE